MTDKSSQTDEFISDEIAEHFRKEMLGPGWCIIDTSSFFEGWTPPPLSQFIGWSDAGKKFDWEPDLEDSAAPISYLDFARQLICSLPNEQLDLGGVDVRRDGVAGDFFRRDLDNVSDWHYDGRHVRGICCVSGEATEVKNDDKIIAVPQKHTLFITGKERTNNVPTLHRRPKIQCQDRTVIVMGFDWFGHR